MVAWGGRGKDLMLQAISIFFNRNREGLIQPTTERVPYLLSVCLVCKHKRFNRADEEFLVDGFAILRVFVRLEA